MSNQVFDDAPASPADAATSATVGAPGGAMICPVPGVGSYSEPVSFARERGAIQRPGGVTAVSPPAVGVVLGGVSGVVAGGVVGVLGASIQIRGGVGSV